MKRFAKSLGAKFILLAVGIEVVYAIFYLSELRPAPEGAVVVLQMMLGAIIYQPVNWIESLFSVPLPLDAPAWPTLAQPLALAGSILAACMYWRLRYGETFKRSTTLKVIAQIGIIFLAGFDVSKSIWLYCHQLGVFPDLNNHHLLTYQMTPDGFFLANSYDLWLSLALIWQMLTPKMWNKQKNKVAPEHYETKSVSD
jgi:hypothetical protein